jgi:hypothetical protein
MPPSQPQNIIHGWNSNSENEKNNINNKTRLRNELTNLYGGNNGFLNSREINGFVGKLNRNSTNTLNIKKQAYKKAYTKYMNYMTSNFAQDMIRELKKKMKSSPTCPTGVEGGGPSFIGTAKAVFGGVKAAWQKKVDESNQNRRQNGRPSRSTAGQAPARIANGNRAGAPQARSR